MENEIEKLKLEKNDVLILKGEWNKFGVENIARVMSNKDLNNMIIVLANDLTIETMKEADLKYTLEKLIQKKEKDET